MFVKEPDIVPLLQVLTCELAPPQLQEEVQEIREEL
jgi:hypothetical protein